MRPTTDAGAAGRQDAAGRVTAANEPEPSDGLRAFGEVLKTLRRRALLTQESLAQQIDYSVHFVASVEQGRRLPPRRFVAACESAVDGLGVLHAAAKHLSAQRGLASWFRAWANLEHEALALHTYECRLIPGLLQTEAYARTLFVNQLPPLGDEQIEAQLEARLERQKLLSDRTSTAYSFILEEHLFLRGTGGPEVTQGLLDHVIAIAQQRNVEVQVMPVVSPGHAGLGGPVQLLESADNRWYAYVEGQESGHLIADAKVVSMLQMRYARMRSQALSLDDSLGLLRQMRGAGCATTN